MASIISIVNKAFILLGKSPVIDAESMQSNPQYAAAVDVYEVLVQSVLGSCPWNFAKKSFELNILVAPPIVTRWPKQAQLPADLLFLYRTDPIINYEIFQDKMYLDDIDQLIIDYTFRQTEDNFTAIFTEAITLMLTSQICMNITQSPQLTEYWGSQAAEKMLIAKHINSVSQPQAAPVRDALRTAHYGSSRSSLIRS